MGNYYENRSIDRWLDKYNNHRDLPLRKLTESEFETYQSIRDLWHEFNILLTEMITIVNVVRAFDDPALERVYGNLFATINSLKKQRDKSYVVRNAYCVLPPTEDEQRGVRYFVVASRRRIDFVAKTVLSANVGLTPVQDYLEIAGFANVRDAAYAHFGSRPKMIDAQKDGGLDIYADEIVKTLKAAGRSEDYKTRLSEYISKTEGKQRPFLEARKAENEMKRKKLLTDGVDIFHRKFYRAIDHLEGDDSIGLSAVSVQKKIDAHGRSGWFVIQCSLSGKRCIYRYLKWNGDTANNFFAAHIYENMEDAKAAAERLSQFHPDKVYDYMQICEAG